MDVRIWTSISFMMMDIETGGYIYQGLNISFCVTICEMNDIGIPAHHEDR